MKTIANIIWLIVAGIWLSIGYFLSGLLLCITLIGIPLGVQCFKIGSFLLAPFGKKVKTNFEAHPIANIIWLVLFGWEAAVASCIAGLVLCVTIIGIPIGIKCFGLAKLVLIPFGAEF